MRGVAIDETYSFARERVREIAIFPDHLCAPTDPAANFFCAGQLVAVCRKVGVLGAEEAVELVKASLLRLELGLLAQMPFTHETRGVSRSFEAVGHGGLSER